MDHLFTIKKVSQLDLNALSSLKQCIFQYLVEAKETGLEEHQIMNQIEMSLKEGVWFLYDDEAVAGFLVGGIRSDQYGEKKGFVDYLFVNAKARALGYAKELASFGIEWVKSLGVKSIVFVTRRNPEAMCRYLPGDWKVDSTVLSLCV